MNAAAIDTTEPRKPTGVSPRAIRLRNKRGRCGACGDENHPYMLKDRHWRALTAGTDIKYLCLFCVDELIGEPLERRHFKHSVPTNSWLRWSDGLIRILPSALAWMWIEAFMATQLFEESMGDLAQ